VVSLFEGRDIYVRVGFCMERLVLEAEGGEGDTRSGLLFPDTPALPWAIIGVEF
jgi:hypothetical protein